MVSPMSKIISEENPNAPQPSGGADEKIRKQARQLAYDVRYKVKQGFKDGQKSDPASLKRAYMSQLGKSPATGPVRLLAKKMLVGESYDFVDITETANNAVADAIKKVFVKTIELDDADGNPAYEITDLVVKEESQEKKYKVRVTDKKTGKSYTRFADRDKISELRKNPNISSVEMTGYGTPYEGEKKKGEQTAAVKAGKDFDGDGKRESSSKEHAGVVHNAIQKKKGGIADGKDTRKEEFIGEVKDVENDNSDANTKKVDVMKGKNKITINPTQAEAVDPAMGDKKTDTGIDAKQKRVAIMKRQILQRKMQAVRGGAGADIVAHNELEGEVIMDDAQYGYDKDGKSLNPKDKEKEGGKLPKNTIEFDGGCGIEPIGDPREIPTLVNLVKNKLRARGLNMSYEPKGEVVSEKKADKDYDGDGKVESGKDEYFGSKDKAIKKAMGKKHDCASKVKHEEYGLGDCIKGMHDLDESGNVAHYDVFFEHGIEKDVDVSSLEILEYKMHEHVIRDGEQLDELNKAERVDAGQGKRAAKKGDWSKQKAKTGKRNINRFETKPVEREHGTLDKGKQSFKKVKVLNPKSGYSKKTDATKGKVTSRKLSQTGTDSKPDYGPQKPHWAGNVHSDRAQQQRRSEHKAKRGVKTKGTVASDIKKSMKETLDPLVQSAVDSLNSYYSKNEGYQRDPDQQKKERGRSKQSDPSKAGFTGISDDIGEIMRQNAAMKKAAAAKKVKKEELDPSVQSALDALNQYSSKKD
tara:strand:+ start:898 stop:3156 length:2259 start_codon:yes stop_codon:yes gene_type:complete